MRLLLALILLSISLNAQNLHIRLVVGQGAINVLDDKAARHFTIRLEEEFGVPGKEIPVTFTLPTAGPSGYFTGKRRTVTVVTDEKGYAVASGFRPNKMAGQYEITVSAAAPAGEIHTAIPQTNALAEGGRLSPKKLVANVRSAAAGLIRR